MASRPRVMGMRERRKPQPKNPKPARESKSRRKEKPVPEKVREVPGLAAPEEENRAQKHSQSIEGDHGEDENPEEKGAVGYLKGHVKKEGAHKEHARRPAPWWR
jgi:outer membrane biosynthesis protein TonB